MCTHHSCAELSFGSAAVFADLFVDMHIEVEKSTDLFDERRYLKLLDASQTAE